MRKAALQQTARFETGTTDYTYKCERCVSAALHYTAEQYSKAGRTKPRKRLTRSDWSWNTRLDFPKILSLWEAALKTERRRLLKVIFASNVAHKNINVYRLYSRVCRPWYFCVLWCCLFCHNRQHRNSNAQRADLDENSLMLTLLKAAKSICTTLASCRLSNGLCEVWETHRRASQEQRPSYWLTGLLEHKSAFHQPTNVKPTPQLEHLWEYKCCWCTKFLWNLVQRPVSSKLKKNKWRSHQNTTPWRGATMWADLLVPLENNFKLKMAWWRIITTICTLHQNLLYSSPSVVVCTHPCLWVHRVWQRAPV